MIQPVEAIVWSALPDPAGLRTGIVEWIFAVPGGFIAAGCTALSGTDCDVPAVWTSADAEAWSEPTLLPVIPGETSGMAGAVALTPAGLVVGGYGAVGDRSHAALWFSPDSRSFERIVDDASFADATVTALTTVGDRFVAVGAGAFMEYFGFHAWSSDDGRAWVEATPAGSDEAFPVGLLALESGLLAWGPMCSDCPAETAWWRSEDGLSWTATGNELAAIGSFAYATAVGESPGGLVAFGTTGVDPVKPAAWSLADGADRWMPIEPPAQPVGAPVGHYLRIGNSAVLAGTSSNVNLLTGLVWLSDPGDASWRPDLQLPGVQVIGLLQDPVRLDRLVVVGQSVTGDRVRIVLWRGTLGQAP